jgi:hypothetical protein
MTINIEEQNGREQEPIIVNALMPQFTYQGVEYGFTIKEGLLPVDTGHFGDAMDYVTEYFVGEGVEKGMGSAGPLDLTHNQLGPERPIGIVSRYFSPDTHLLSPDDPIVKELEPRLLELLVQYMQNEGLI